MANSIINADSEGLKSTGGDGNTLILQTGGNAAITVNSTQVVTLAAPLPVASGGTGSNTGSGATLTDLNASSITSGTLSVNRIADSSITSGKLASGAAASNLGNYVSTVNGSTGAVTVQATLVSGTNIKTINSTSLLGSGDITVGASTSFNAVGTYVFGRIVAGGSDTYNSGSTFSAGSGYYQLVSAVAYGDGGNWSNLQTQNNLSGTWRLMNAWITGGGQGYYWVGIFVRVS